MKPHFYVRLAILILAVILFVAAVQAWRANRRDRTQLAETLASLATEKRTVITPAQILCSFPSQIPLPAPITLQAGRTPSQGTSATPANATNAPASKAAGASSGSNATASQPDQKARAAAALIPVEDLKPLYDFTLDCKACQAKLSAAQNDLADERQKTVALTKERDDALRIAKGGSTWRRVGRAAKWFLLGAAAGAVVSRAR